MQKSLFGYGLTTKAIADKFGNFFIYDDKFTKIEKDDKNNTFLPTKEFNPLKSELEIVSPGFKKDHFLMQNAKHLLSEYDYFYDIMPKSIWISGTNGKSTTTQMTQHLLESINSQMGANIGIPLANLDPYAKVWILETSSFTLHYTKKAKPEIYALLPVTQDHISWHGSFKEYEKAKLSVLKRMKESDVAILPKKYEKIKTKAFVIYYENEEDLANKMQIDIKKIKFQTPFLLDAIISLSIEKILLDRISYKKINNFKIEKNKLETIKDKKNRIWINDTKATNKDATLAALKRYEKEKVYLIIGGDDKGANFDDLFKYMKNLNIKLFIIGSNTQKMIIYAKKYNIAYEKCEFLKIAVKKINEILQKNEIALLSPACASLDQFKSYIQRGDEFKKLIKEVNGG